MNSRSVEPTVSRVEQWEDRDRACNSGSDVEKDFRRRQCRDTGTFAVGMNARGCLVQMEEQLSRQNEA